MEVIKNFIGGEFVAPIGGEYLDNYEPATGKVYGKIPSSDARDVEEAIAAAKSAFTLWSGMAREQRSRILLKLADLIEDHIEILAAAEAKDNGKPITLARKVDIPRSAQNFRFFGTGILHFASEAHIHDDIAVNYTQRHPLGVVGCISPWNLPLYLFSWKIAPALAAGNTVVAKPSEVTPMTAFMLAELCQKAGMPAGVLNIVHGLGAKAGTAICAHPDIKAISFTGGTKTGADIARIAAPQFKKMSLELGGKNPNIIFADCDFEAMLETTVRSSFSNQGQICLCGSRIFIEKSLYPRFRDAFVEKVKKLKVGDPNTESSDLGAVVSKEHLGKILGFIEAARQDGGKVLAGGQAATLSGRCSEGYFVLPTVIEGLGPECRINQEEVFGPVVTLMPFTSEEEVIRDANSTPYGLAASIWTKDVTRAHRVASLIKSGIVWVNCWMVRDLRTPFGGMKQSGVGREGGFEALKFFTEPQNICIKLS